MFDGLKNLGNLPGLMAKAREMQDKMKLVQEELGRRHVTANSGGGVVEATVNGKMELLKLRIDKSRVNLDDMEMIEDLVVAAVNAAQAKAAGMVQAEMQKMTADLGLPPGLLP